MVGKFVLQWHITEKCNLKCRHCYQIQHEPVQLEKKQLFSILQQFKDLLGELKVVGHINLTGGEPLVSPVFFDLLGEFKKDKSFYSFSILTNGTLIDDDVAGRIATYNPEYVQVSLEGGRITNDDIRGRGNFVKVGRAIDSLKKHGLYVSLSFTAQQNNYREFPKVVRFAVKHRVNNVWSDRYIPLGDTPTVKPLNQKQTREYLRLMLSEREKLKEKKYCPTMVAMYRALQFQMTNDFPYACTAGDSLLTVMENGDLVPCRRLPIVVGNLLTGNMIDLYHNNPTLRKLQSENIPDDCRFCEHDFLCKGGLKCLTHARYSDLNHKDIGCDISD